MRAILAFVVVGMPTYFRAECIQGFASNEKACSTSDTVKGTAALATFTACSSLSSGDVRTTAHQLSKDKSMEKHLKTKAARCAALPTVDEKQACLASFMGTMAADHILTMDSSSNNDDASAKDLVTTCSCLKTAVEDMPNCGTFAEFFEVNEILPTSQGVCADVSAVCNHVSDFSKLCLDSDAHFSFSTTTCAAVLATSDRCTKGAEEFWAMGFAGANYCGLKQWQLNRLSNYDFGCPHEGAAEANIYTTAALRNFVGFVFLVGVCTAACWHYRRTRSGLVYRPPQAYKPLSTDELEVLSNGNDFYGDEVALSGYKAGHTFATAPTSESSTEPDAMEL